MSRVLLRAGLLAGLAAVPSAVAAQSTAAGAQNDEVVVTGVKLRSEASAGTKTDTPLAETPQSISVIDASEIADLRLQNLNQALRLVAGVTPETRGASAEVYDQFKLRGFDAPVYLDGLRLFGSATGYAVPQVDVSRIDRIEVVKGPASALYGQSGPGGLVAEESKLPLDRARYGAVVAGFGTYDQYRVDADIGGKVSDAVLWRLYGSANGAHDQHSYGRRDRQTVSGAVTLGANGRTSLTVLGNYSHDPRNGNYGVFPALGTLIANPAGRISTRFYGGEPDDFFSRNQASGTYILRHDFGGGWVFRASGRYLHVSSRLGLVYTGGYPVDAFAASPRPAPTLFSRYSYSTDERLDSWTYDNQLTGSVQTGPLRHELLFGVDRQVAHSRETYAFGGATPIDVFNPVYGTMPTPRTPDTVPGYTGGLATPSYQFAQQRQQGIYAQDQIAVGGLRVTLSGRHDWAHNAQPASALIKDDAKFTYRVGALYRLPVGLPYLSYSTSFQPQAAALASGGLANPSLGKQFEAGLKYQPPGTQILVTGAWFDIRQSNVVVSDPLTFLSYQVGRVRSRGVEIEATAPLPHGFNARVAFSRQNVKTLDDVDLSRIGQGLATVGRGGISANLEWAPTTGPAAGFAIGGVVRHVDSTYADRYLDGVAYNTPAYTVFDGLLRYDLAGWSRSLAGVKVGVNATNILDKKYLTSCFANYGWCWYGNRRTVEGTIGFSW
jgi:iron complex outermembrane receptor protein